VLRIPLRAQRLQLPLVLLALRVDRRARRIEPRAPTPDARLRAIARLHDAGVAVSVNCMPVLPGITDHPRDLEALVERVAEAGASHISTGALRLQHEARKRYLPFIAKEFPELAPRYARAYAHAHVPGDLYRERLAALMARLCRAHGLRRKTYEGGDDAAAAADSPNDTAGDADAASEADLQLSLAL